MSVPWGTTRSAAERRLLEAAPKRGSAWGSAIPIRRPSRQKDPRKICRTSPSRPDSGKRHAGGRVRARRRREGLRRDGARGFLPPLNQEPGNLMR
jgi:hypothetical protein